MNEHEPASSPDAAPAPQHEAAKPNLLRTILFAILAVMVVALVYEYGFMLRSYRAAENNIDQMIEDRHLEPVTPEGVQAKFGKQPVSGLEDKGHYYLEHHRWRRWLPWRTFDIYVVYDDTDPPTLYNASRPGPPRADEVPGKQPVLTELDMAEMPESEMAEEDSLGVTSRDAPSESPSDVPAETGGEAPAADDADDAASDDAALDDAAPAEPKSDSEVEENKTNDAPADADAPAKDDAPTDTEARRAGNPTR
ncbi:MAG: hypothetical protein KY475_02495 [Planctomycetes bacterium]|nr:hypothetical protein [Planctomycetota bacterium]